MDREFDYEALGLALRTLEDGGPFVATNPDRTCPTETGAIPDAAGMIGAIEGVTGRSVDEVLGKPSPTMVETALDRVGVEPAECLMVGDRIETDIRMGERAGMTTVLVLSGVTDRETLRDSEVDPDYVLESLAELGEQLE
jgi:arabinose operon protein AraL